jgi:hypothetical protein
MTVTVNRIEREVEVKDIWGDGEALDTGCIFLCKHRTGQKLYPTYMRFWRQKDGSYKPDFRAVALNRQAQIVAWKDDDLLKPLIHFR